jgi:hypothetical protein
VKLKDYDAGAQTEAENEYAAWAGLRNTEQPLNVGDLLESETGQLRICKYVGFEEARWFAPEPTQAALATTPTVALPPVPPSGAQAQG